MNYRKSRLSWHKQEQLINYFVAGSTAHCASELVGIHRNSAILYFCRLHEIIAYELDKESDEYFFGEIEVDESYFGKIIKMLIDVGADVNATDNNGETSLNKALMFGHDEIAELLINAGAK